MTFAVRQLREDEAARLRRLRLRALREDPDAFAASFDAATTMPPSFWADWSTAAALSESDVTLVAVDGDRWLGMVVGRQLTETPGSAWLEALWVDPRARRTGLGLVLIEAVAAWSRGFGAGTLELSVTEGNAPARGLYARAGFRETGRRRPLPADPSRLEIFLSRPL